MYISIIVLAYYLGDFQPKNDDPFDAFDKVLKLPADPDLMPISDLRKL